MRPVVTMIDHYNDLGFLVRTDVDLKKLIERAFDEGQRIDSDGGYYLRWRPGSDIELWVQVDRGNDIMGCLPHFNGHGWMTLEIQELAWVDKLNTALEGILSCNSCPEADGFEEDISVPVLADSPDFGILRHSLRCPVKVRAQVTAFAHEIRCFENEDEHQEAQQQELPPPPIGPESSDLKEKARRRIDRMTRAAESYFPIGQSSRPRTSRVGFAGHIRRTAILVNPVTMQGFYHLVVKSYGGLVVDVVADPSLVKGTPADAGILEGICCLSARVEL